MKLADYFLVKIPFLQPLGFRHGWCHCNVIHPRLYFATGKGETEFPPIPATVCSLRSRLLLENTLGWMESILADLINPLRKKKKKNHMYHCHSANIFGDNNLIVSINLLSVLFFAAETIWHVIRPYGRNFSSVAGLSCLWDYMHSSWLKKEWAIQSNKTKCSKILSSSQENKK